MVSGEAVRLISISQHRTNTHRRNPLGVWGIGGLFLAPLWPLLRHSFPTWLLLSPPAECATAAFTAADISRRVVRALFDWLGWVVLSGRLLSAGVEVYFVGGLVRMLVDEDEEAAAVGGGRREKAS